MTSFRLRRERNAQNPDATTDVTTPDVAQVGPGGANPGGPGAPGGSEDSGDSGDGGGDGLLSNTGWLIGSRLVMAALGWAGTLLIARHLSLDEFGRFTIIFTILGLMSVVTDMGIGRIALRGMLGSAETEPGDFAGTYIALRTALGFLGYGLVMLIVVILGYPGEVIRATAVAAVVIVLATPSAALDVVFQSRLKLGTVSIAGVSGQMAQFGLTAAIAASGGTVLYFTIPAVLAQLVVLAIKIPAAYRLLPIRLHIDLAVWRMLLKESIPLTLGIGLATIYYRVDSVMLSRLDTFDSVGIYGVSYKFIDIVQFAATAVTVPLLTLLVQAWPHDMEAFRSAMRRGAMIMGILGGLALVGLLGFPAQLTTALYGEPYAVGANATRLLITSQFLTLFTTLGLTCLIALARHRTYPFVMLTGLVINLSANAILIPRYSYEGAAVATLGAEVIVVTLMWTLVRREAALWPLGLGPLVAVPLSVAAALGVGWSIDLVVPWFFAAVAATFVFVAGVVLGGVTGAAGINLPGPLGRKRVQV